MRTTASVAVYVGKMADQDDEMKPDWNAVAKVGIPGVIALFLVYNLATGFEKFDKRLEAMEGQHNAAAQSADSAKDLAGRSLMTNERILWVLSIMCANDAKTSEARERCLSQGR